MTREKPLGHPRRAIGGLSRSYRLVFQFPGPRPPSRWSLDTTSATSIFFFFFYRYAAIWRVRKIMIIIYESTGVSAVVMQCANLSRQISFSIVVGPSRPLCTYSARYNIRPNISLHDYVTLSQYYYTLCICVRVYIDGMFANIVLHHFRKSCHDHPVSIPLR